MVSSYLDYLFDNFLRYYPSIKKLNYDFESLEYTLPQYKEPKKDIDNNLILFKYPSQYKHHPILQYNIGLVIYFTAFNGIFSYFAYYANKKSGLLSKKFLFVGLSVNFMLNMIETYFAYTRIQDVEEIKVKNCKTLMIKTRQYPDKYLEMDIKDLRVVNKSITTRGDGSDSECEPGLTLNVTDRSKINDKSGRIEFFIIEPNFGNTPDRNIFDHVFRDRRYLKFYQ